MQISLVERPNQESIEPEPTFGAVLAELFLVLSVLSKQGGPSRLPPISTLHHYPILGYGRSFVARLVPASSFGQRQLNLRGEEHVVFKSLRHRESINPELLLQDERVPRLQNFLRELRVLTHSPLRNHENIVRLIGVGWERNRLSTDTSIFHWPFLVLEHAKYGSLIDFLEESPVDFDTRRGLCHDVGLGLHALHDCDVIHGDIKPENVLVCHHATRKYIAKIADFGFTMFDLEGRAPTTQRLGWSAPWEAPESARSLGFKDRMSTDVYSYGFLIWRTVSYGHHPFDQRHGLLSTQSTGMIDSLKKTDRIPTFAAELLKEFLEDSLLESVVSALEETVRLSPAARTLNDSLDSLRLEPDSFDMIDLLTGCRSNSTLQLQSSTTPIRSTVIPHEVS
jgi:serine/threonine protein kinase